MNTTIHFCDFDVVCKHHHYFLIHLLRFALGTETKAVTGGMLTGNTFLVRLERRKRIWWLQILFLPRFRKLTTPQASSKSLSCI